MSGSGGSGGGGGGGKEVTLNGPAAVPLAAAPPLLTISRVVVHPLVLLSVVDHYARVAKNTKKRVVGVLLGEVIKGQVDVTNSFAVPFDEDDKEGVWYLDHTYHETMFDMFKRVSAKERVIGWYSTGPKIKPVDLEINNLFYKYCAKPVFVIIGVKPSESHAGLPVEAYVAVEEIKEDGRATSRIFQHVPSELGAFEPEEIGVEHLLRDVKDSSIAPLAAEVSSRLVALKSLQSKMMEIQEYLENCGAKRLPVNNDIVGEIQQIFNLIPNQDLPELMRAFTTKSNDIHLTLYIASLVRSLLALHNLINNKITNLADERKRDNPAPTSATTTSESGDGKENEKSGNGDKEKEKSSGGKDKAAKPNKK